MSADACRMFPIIRDVYWPDAPAAVPWPRLERFEIWAQRNHGGQTLAGLARRGGLAPDELLAVVEQRPWHPILPYAEASRRLHEWLARPE